MPWYLQGHGTKACEFRSRSRSSSVAGKLETPTAKSGCARLPKLAQINLTRRVPCAPMSVAGRLYEDMSSGNLQALAESIPLPPEQLSLGCLLLFISLASKLKDDITLTQPAHIPA